MILSEEEKNIFDSEIEKNKKQRVFLKLKKYYNNNTLHSTQNMGIHNCQQSVRWGWQRNALGKIIICSIVEKLTDPIQIQFYNEIIVPLLESNLVKSHYSLGKTGIMRVILFDKPDHYNLKMFAVVNIIRSVGRFLIAKLGEILKLNKELAEEHPELSLISRYQLITLKYYDFLNSRDVDYWPKLVNQEDVNSMFVGKDEYLFKALNKVDDRRDINGRFVNGYRSRLNEINKMNAKELLNLVKENQ